jgi:S1-C subfamily serine protease
MKSLTAPSRRTLGALVGAGVLIAGGTAAVPAQAASGNLGTGVVIIETNLGYQGGQAAGTGMVLTSSGEVLTNNHVVEGATSIKAIIPGTSKSYDAKVLGYSATDDVAVIQLSGASGLDTISPANSDSVQVGQSVTALGNAGGTGSLTPAQGQVTGLNRSITAGDEAGGSSEQLSGLIETDANVQPGDSGGPLLDSSGHVIGMDTAASSGNGFASMYGQSGGADAYAVPINHALSIAKQIESGNGSATVHVGGTAFLGVQVDSSSNASAGGYSSPGAGSDPYGYGSGGYGGYGGYGSDPYGYGSGGYGGYGGYGSDPYGYGSGSYGSTDPGSASGSAQTGGAVIAGVVQGGPADQAGLTQGDTITGIDGTTIDSPDALTSALEPMHPGQKVSVAFVDQNGNSQTVTVTLGSGPAK